MIKYYTISPSAMPTIFTVITQSNTQRVQPTSGLGTHWTVISFPPLAHPVFPDICLGCPGPGRSFSFSELAQHRLILDS